MAFITGFVIGLALGVLLMGTAWLQCNEEREASRREIREYIKSLEVKS